MAIPRPVEHLQDLGCPRPVEHFQDLGLRVLSTSTSFEGIVFCVGVLFVSLGSVFIHVLCGGLLLFRVTHLEGYFSFGLLIWRVLSLSVSFSILFSLFLGRKFPPPQPYQPELRHA